MELLSNNVLTFLPAFAAAVAAWFSFRTSKQSLNFQKQFAKNRAVISQLEISITKLRTINTILNSSLPISDQLFMSIDSLVDEVIVELYSYMQRGLLENSELSHDTFKNSANLNLFIAKLEGIVDSFF